MKKHLLYTMIALLALTLMVPALAQENAGPMAMSPTEGLTAAADPVHPVGASVILAADHMPGMRGAAARVSGAFETVLYAVNYTRADNGEKVENHRWVIREEIEGHGVEPFKVGDVVTLLPGHISSIGGEDVKAEIAEVVPGVAYMVDFQPTDGGETVVNHQWLSEEELLSCCAIPGLPGGK